MIIETKFGIGDEVWGIQSDLQPEPWNLYRGGAPLVIDHIGIHIGRSGEPSTCHYGVHAPGIAGSSDSLIEVFLFPTAAEAQAECDRRNAETAE